MDSALKGIRHFCCFIISLSGLFWGHSSFALSPETVKFDEVRHIDNRAPDALGQHMANNVSELKNRFRIDHKVSGLTLFVQREFGSAPVVIVLPDGHKWYANHHPDQVKWAQGKTGDMIVIDNPMPGPWQLLGQINSGSTVTKVSHLAIQIDDIPQPVFQGERLKLTATLSNETDKLRLPGLDYLFKWQARFISEGDVQDENFAVGSVDVGQYFDNGEGFDEVPDDGVFTSLLDFNQAWGNYIFEVKMYNAIFEREHRIAFRLSKSPINIRFISDLSSNEAERSLLLEVDDEVLFLNETKVVLELIGPTGKRKVIELNDINGSLTQVTLPRVTHLGGYRVNVSAISTVKGKASRRGEIAAENREIYLTLPALFFNLIQLPQRLTLEELIAANVERTVIAEQNAKRYALTWIILGNFSLLLMVGLVFGIGMKRKKVMNAKRAQQRSVKQSQAEMSLMLDEIDLTLPDGKF
ncbi:TIGR03503 family protein [uncultured Shewanella sp.]|uniref:TIGR03503 family protein n=1 Tax=uncultured Shewanella sp. TaxID=173975 RepID=UPI00260826CE|nr:TIGR03503 family protein [uncultured Shewanella sp.]